MGGAGKERSDWKTKKKHKKPVGQYETVTSGRKEKKKRGKGQKPLSRHRQTAKTPLKKNDRQNKKSGAAVKLIRQQDQTRRRTR